MKKLKITNKKCPKVDFELLAESLKLSRRLASRTFVVAGRLSSESGASPALPSRQIELSLGSVFVGNFYTLSKTLTEHNNI
jgi:hypothetical protein